MGVPTLDELLRLGREALAAADWQRELVFEQAADLGETAEVLDGLGRRNGVGRWLATRLALPATVSSAYRGGR
jgi:hypothetical protein